MNADGVGAIDRVMQRHFQDLVAWTMTAKAWEEFGADQVVLAYGGDGQALELADGVPRD